ncbi:hypothetical protein A8C56_18790 [Niabella ginsenosidivorans]|uniref:Uncharacterized protein n=1 Tax=Niabella ginsenosidivorans TaxID=1176587 RepID=A0A1A9I7T0_9BACT|nr:hypothetical protein A8C56_18790 [Niabella ginsenosidivorans]
MLFYLLNNAVLGSAACRKGILCFRIVTILLYSSEALYKPANSFAKSFSFTCPIPACCGNNLRTEPLNPVPSAFPQNLWQFAG